MDDKLDIIKVSASSDVNKVAGSIVAMFKNKGYSEIRVVGAGAVNQAVKSIIIARSMLNSDLIETVVIPSFENVKSDREGVDVVTAIKFKLIKITITGG